MVLLLGKMRLDLRCIPTASIGLVAVKAGPGLLVSIGDSGMVLDNVGVLPNTVKCFLREWVLRKWDSCCSSDLRRS